MLEPLPRPICHPSIHGCVEIQDQQLLSHNYSRLSQVSERDTRHNSDTPVHGMLLTRALLTWDVKKEKIFMGLVLVLW